MRLTQPSFNLPDGTWRLSQPAGVTQREDSLLIDQLMLRNGEQQVLVDGRFSFAGSQSLKLNIDGFPP